MTFKISVDKEKCIGCGACAGMCDNFEMKDGKSIVKKAEVDEVGCNEDAKNACPVQAITVKEV